MTYSARPMRHKLVIAVDGPAASGKGTVARALAEHFGLPHLDTGLLYRAVGWRAGEAAALADVLAVASALDPAWLDDPVIRSEAAARYASIVSAIPEVRAALLARQRAFADQPDGAVLDGRDIGTVIVPHAHAKLFVTASVEARARRRSVELGRAFETVLADLAERDRRDAERTTAPLLRASDADLLDTTDLPIDAAVRRAIALVEARIGRAR